MKSRQEIGIRLFGVVLVISLLIYLLVYIKYVK
jgi:hypothetical protein